MPVDPDPGSGGSIPAHIGGIRPWSSRYWKQRGYSCRRRYWQETPAATGVTIILTQQTRHLTAVCEFLASDFNNSSVNTFRNNTTWPAGEQITVAASNGDIESFTYTGDWRIEEIDFAFNDTPICTCTVQLVLKEAPEVVEWDEF